MNEFSKARHDFINNAIRIEVLNNLITESLDKDDKINDEYLNDLSKFLDLHKQLLEKFKV